MKTFKNLMAALALLASVGLVGSAAAADNKLPDLGGDPLHHGHI